MYEVVSGDPRGLRDALEFVDGIADPRRHASPAVRDLFDVTSPVVVSRAPGRLDVMGGIADYSGSLVLQMPTSEAALCALQRSADDDLRVVSLGADQREPEFRCRFGELFPGGAPLGYEAARAFFRRDGRRNWAGYMAGCFLVLAHERRLRFEGGVRILVDSAVPEGKGVSSSAAIEVSVMTAISDAFGLGLEARDVALLCQRVENEIVGAPCGVMDQMASSCGREGSLLALRCQPAEILGTLAIPDDLGVWGIDSGIRHAVSGDDYAGVRCGAFMGFTMLRVLAGARAESWGGYLANVGVDAFEAFEAELPLRVDGADFLEQYGSNGDAQTRVSADRDYALRAATAHPIYENDRIQKFAELLDAPGPGTPTGSAERNAVLGRFMFESHASYSRCGLGSEGTDALVDAVAAQGVPLHGAKITGGGSGGTVAVLGEAGSDGLIRSVASEYQRASGRAPYIFVGSSPGAAEFGTLRLEWR